MSRRTEERTATPHEAAIVRRHRRTNADSTEDGLTELADGLHTARKKIPAPAVRRSAPMLTHRATRSEASSSPAMSLSTTERRAVYDVGALTSTTSEGWGRLHASLRTRPSLTLGSGPNGVGLS
jgi:hypothetical protein